MLVDLIRPAIVLCILTVITQTKGQLRSLTSDYDETIGLKCAIGMEPDGESMRLSHCVGDGTIGFPVCYTTIFEEQDGGGPSEIQMGCRHITGREPLKISKCDDRVERDGKGPPKNYKECECDSGDGCNACLGWADCAKRIDPKSSSFPPMNNVSGNNALSKTQHGLAYWMDEDKDTSLPVYCTCTCTNDTKFGGGSSPNSSKYSVILTVTIALSLRVLTID